MPSALAIICSNKPLRTLYNWYQTFGNANRNLEIIINPRNKKQKSYVVIYGAHNNGSRAFCRFLAEYGYSLILIDREESLLNSAEKHILSEFPELSLIKVRMDEFDEVETLRVVKQVNKLGDVIRGLVMTKNIMLSQQNNKRFEELTYEEIHQIMQNNNEMVVGLTNVLLKPIQKAGRGFIVNLRNVKYAKVGDMIYWDLLYYSTSKFSSTFVYAVHQSVEKIKVIDVQTNYSNIKKQNDMESLCAKTFGYLGILDNIQY